MSPTNESSNVPARNTVIWFGKHQGMRLDEVPDSYRAWAVYSDTAKNFSWHREFVEINQQYLEERMPSLKPDDRPGNQRRSWSKSQPFSVLYHDKKWRAWCHRIGKESSPFWYWEFLDLESQFTRWLDTHRRPYRRREPTMRVNKVGQKCGPWDDELDPVPTNDQYDLDDNFIDDSDLPEVTDDGNYTDDDADSDSDVVESQHADCDDAPVEYAVDEDEDEDEESQDGSQGLVEDNDSATEDDDDDVPIATLRGPRVTMIPGSEGIREAKDLFNDEIDLPERSEVAPKQPSGSPDTPRTPSVAVRKRRRVQRSDSEHNYENPAAARKHRQKRRREVQVSGDESDASHARQVPGVAERLSQVVLQTPPRPGRRGSRGGMRLRRSDAR